MGPQQQRLRHAVGFEELPKVAGLILGFLVLLLLLFTVLIYLDARELAAEERLAKLAGGGLGAFDPTLVSLLLTGLGLLLRYCLVHAPELDAMLVCPLTGRQIFWAGFRRVLGPTLVFGAAICLPWLGHLLGLGADLWLLAAAAALWLCGFVLLLAAAALLALAGGVVCWLPLAAVFAWGLWHGGGPLPGARLAALAGVTGWHPVAVALPAVAAAGALALVLDHLLAGRLYTAAALTAKRDRPTPWWQRLSQPGPEGVRLRPSSGTWLARRLTLPAHGLWRLIQRDETPEAFARRIPQVAAWYGLWLAAAHWRLGAAEPSSDEVVLLGIAFLCAWLLAIALLATPSGRPWLLGRTPAESPVMTNQPLREIFPVSPRVYTAAVFCCATFLNTLTLLLFLPFALLSPLPAGSVLRSLGVFWVVIELLHGLSLAQLPPRLDPRRPGFTWWRLAAVTVAVIASGLALSWLVLADLVRSDAFLWTLAAFRELFAQYPAASFGCAALLAALLELLAILASLRSHEKRWFDAAW